MSYSFDVILNRKVVDTIFQTFSSGTRTELCESVKSSLINHDGYDPCIKVRFNGRLTCDEWHVEGYYSYCGWECVTTETSRKEAMVRLKEYRENEAGTAFRVVKRKVRAG